MLLMRATAFLATVSFGFVYCLPFAACASSLSCLVFFNKLVSLYTLSFLSGLYGEAYQPPALGFGFPVIAASTWFLLPAIGFARCEVLSS